MLEQGKRVRSPPPEEEEGAEAMCDDRNPHSPSPCATPGEVVEKWD